MLFGVPVGQQTIHFDLDLSDMGDLSLTPADLVASGVAENEFSSVSTSSGNNELKYKTPLRRGLNPYIRIFYLSSNYIMKAISHKYGTGNQVKKNCGTR